MSTAPAASLSAAPKLVPNDKGSPRWVWFLTRTYQGKTDAAQVGNKINAEAALKQAIADLTKAGIHPVYAELTDQTGNGTGATYVPSGTGIKMTNPKVITGVELALAPRCHSLPIPEVNRKERAALVRAPRAAVAAKPPKAETKPKPSVKPPKTQTATPVVQVKPPKAQTQVKPPKAQTQVKPKPSLAVVPAPARVPTPAPRIPTPAPRAPTPAPQEAPVPARVPTPTPRIPTTPPRMATVPPSMVLPPPPSERTLPPTVAPYQQAARVATVPPRMPTAPPAPAPDPGDLMAMLKAQLASAIDQA